MHILIYKTETYQKQRLTAHGTDQVWRPLSFTFKRWGFVYTVHQSLINWLLLRRYSGSWDQC